MNEEAPSPFETNATRRKLFKKSLTPEQRKRFNELRKKDWWWRNIRRKGVEGVDWPAVEEAARNYELIRRSPRGRKFTRTYLELGRDERTVIHALWPNWPRAPYRMVTNRNQFEEKGWTPIYENQHKQWNLRLSVSDLIKEFSREIRLLQEIQKIRPQHPLTGKKFRGASWKLVEVLDCKLHGIGPLNKSERHTLSDAERRAEKYFKEYKRALAKQKEIKSPLDGLAEKFR